MNELVEAMVRRDIPSSTETEVDMASVKTILDQIKSRFIDERIQGWVHPGTGQQHPPVSREEAERRWEAVRQNFASILVSGATNDPDYGRIRPKLTKPKLAASHYSAIESKAKQCIQKMIHA